MNMSDVHHAVFLQFPTVFRGVQPKALRNVQAPHNGVRSVQNEIRTYLFCRLSPEDIVCPPPGRLCRIAVLCKNGLLALRRVAQHRRPRLVVEHTRTEGRGRRGVFGWERELAKRKTRGGNWGRLRVSSVQR